MSSEVDAETWRREPLTADERSLMSIAGWGPAEDWVDWAEAMSGDEIGCPPRTDRRD